MLESKKTVAIWAECGDDCYYGRGGETVDYETASAFYFKAMKKKHPRATYMLGLCYELGLGVEKDREYAEILYENAAKLGDTDAQKRLKSGKEAGLSASAADKEIAAGIWQTGAAADSRQASLIKKAIKLNERGRFGDAFRILKPLAEEGNPEAMFWLSKDYGGWLKGGEAWEWLKKAAELGHTGAKNALRDERETERKRAAAEREAGEKAAREKQAVSRKMDRAIDLFNEEKYTAAKEICKEILDIGDNPDYFGEIGEAARMMASMFFTGKGVEEDKNIGYQYLLIARKCGNKRADEILKSAGL